LYVLYQIFRVLQIPHLIHTTPRVASVTVTLMPGIDFHSIASSKCARFDILHSSSVGLIE